MRLRQVVTPAGFLLVLTLAVKLAAVWQLAGHPLLQPVGGLDSEHYVALASRVAAGDILLGRDVYYLPPLYTYFLGAVLWMTGHSLVAARVVQALLGTAAVGLVYVAAGRMSGRRAGLVALVLAATTGLFTFYEVLLIQAALDPFLMAASLFAVVRAARGTEGARPGGQGQKEQAWRAAWLIAGVALGLFSLNRPNALPMALGLAALLVLWRGRRGAEVEPTSGRMARRGASEKTAPRPTLASWRASWTAAAALAGGLALAIAPVTLRNVAVSGQPVLITSHGGLNFYIGNNTEADGTYHDVPGITPSIAGQAADMRHVAEQALGRPLSDGEVSGYFYARGRSWMLEHLFRRRQAVLRKIGYTFHAAFLPLTHSYPYYVRDERTILRGLVVGPWLLIPLGVFGLAAGWPRRTLSWYSVWLVVALYALSVAVFFVSARYRMPLLIPMCVASGAAVEWWLARAAPSRKVVGGFVLLALAVLVNRPLALDDGRFEERVRMAVSLVGSGAAARAERLVSQAARAGEKHPSAGLMHYRVGLAYAARGEWEAARRHHEQALRLDPGQGEIELSLGQTMLELGRHGEAVDLLRRAWDRGVRPATGRASLARALEQQGLAHALAGNLRAAAASLEPARELAPRTPSILLNLAVVYAQSGALRRAARWPRRRSPSSRTTSARGGFWRRSSRNQESGFRNQEITPSR